MYSKDGVYNLFRALKDFLRKPTPGKYKHLMENEDFAEKSKYVPTISLSLSSLQISAGVPLLYNVFSPLFIMYFTKYLDVSPRFNNIGFTS